MLTPMAYPPNYMPPIKHVSNENVDHAVPVTFEGQQPQPKGGARKEPQERA